MIMDLIIYSPTEKKVFNKLTSIGLPSEFGQIQILKNHAEMFLILKPCEISIARGKKIEIVGLDQISECRIKDNKISIFS